MTNVDVIERLYRAFGERDERTLRTVLDPAVEWRQCDGFPGGGHHHGVEAVLRDVFGALRDQWEAWRVEIERTLDAGATVIVLGRYRGTHATTQRAMTAEFAHVYDLADHRVVRFTQIADTHPMVDAARGA